MDTEKNSTVTVTFMQYLKSNTTNELAFWTYGWRIVTDKGTGDNCGSLKVAVFFCKLSRIQKNRSLATEQVLIPTMRLCWKKQ